MDLKELRKQIDKIDTELVNLFTARMKISALVADYKKANQLPILVPSREQEVLQQVTEQAGPELAEYVQTLYTLIFEQSRNYQNKRMADQDNEVVS